MAGSGRRPINAPQGGGKPGSGGPVQGLLALAVLLVAGGAIAYFGFGQGADEEPPPPVAGKGATGATGPTAPEDAESDIQGRAEGPLGFPVAATRNTVRVDGSEPDEIAGAVALAAFPATGPGTPPAAVTVVSDERWQDGIAAATLTAGPVGAPILIAPSGRLSDASATVLREMEPVGAPTTGEAEVFAIGDVAVGGGYETAQVPEGTPARVAAEIAQLKFQILDEPPNHIVIAPQDDAGYAMPAAAWAARSGDVVLYSGRDAVPEPTLEMLARKRNAEVPVFVLGPEEAISEAAVEQLEEVSEQVERVGGEDPVTASVEFARYVNGTFGWNLNDPGHGFVVARSDRPLDAVAAAALSTGGTWPAMLLTDRPDTLPEPLQEYLLDIKPGYATDPTRALYNDIWIIGDEEEIDLNQQAQLDDAAELTQVETLVNESGVAP